MGTLKVAVAICCCLFAISQWLCEDHDVHKVATVPIPVSTYARNGVFPAADEPRPVLTAVVAPDSHWQRVITSAPAGELRVLQLDHRAGSAEPIVAPSAPAVAMAPLDSQWVVVLVSSPPRLDCVRVDNPSVVRWTLAVGAAATAQLWHVAGLVLLHGSHFADDRAVDVVAVNGTTGAIVWLAEEKSNPKSTSKSTFDGAPLLDHHQLRNFSAPRLQRGMAWTPSNHAESALMLLDSSAHRVTLGVARCGLVQLDLASGAVVAHWPWDAAPAGTLVVAHTHHRLGTQAAFQWLEPDVGNVARRSVVVRPHADGPLVWLESSGQLTTLSPATGQPAWTLATPAGWAHVADAAAQNARRAHVPGRADGTDLASVVLHGFEPQLLALDPKLIVAVGWASLVVVSVAPHAARVEAIVDLPFHPLPDGVHTSDFNGDGLVDVALLCTDGWHIFIVERHGGSELLRVAWIVQMLLAAVFWAFFAHPDKADRPAHEGRSAARVEARTHNRPAPALNLSWRSTIATRRRADLSHI